MDKNIEEMLGRSIQQVALESLSGVDFEGIFKKQIEDTVRNIARDMFREYGDFGKMLKERLESQMQVKVSEIDMPQFGSLAANIVGDTLASIEIEQKKDIEKKIKERINMYLGANKEPMKLEEIIEKFYEHIYEEKKYSMDICSCDHTEPNGLDDLLEIFEQEDIGDDFELVLNERATNYNWSEGSCISHINLDYKDKNERYGLSLHVNRVEDVENDEKWKSNDYWREGSENLYTILGIDVNGRSISKNGVIVFRDLNNDLERILVSVYQNIGLIDLGSLHHVELNKE